MKQTTTKKLLTLFTAVLIVATLLSVAVFAESTSNALLEQMIEIICSIARLIGILLFVWGVVQFILSTRNDEGDSKFRAGMLIVTAIALFGISFLVKPIVDIIIPNNSMTTDGAF